MACTRFKANRLYFIFSISHSGFDSFTVGGLGGVDGVKLADVGDETDGNLLRPDVRVVPGGAGDEVVDGGLEAVLVEEAGDAWVRHAGPVVGVGVEKSRDNRQPRVC